MAVTATETHRAIEAVFRIESALPRGSVRADLLAKLQRFEEAGPEFERAASLTRNARERAPLLERAAACARSGRDAIPRP